MYRGKISKNLLLNKWFFVIFGLWQEERVFFSGIFLAGLSKLLSTCPEEQLQSNISEKKSWNLEGFWMVFEDFGTMAEIFFQGWQNSKRCPGEQFVEKFFSKEKISLFFPILSGFFYFKRKFSPYLQKPQSTCAWKFLGKNIFWNL